MSTRPDADARYAFNEIREPSRPTCPNDSIGDGSTAVREDDRSRAENSGTFIPI